MRCLIAAALAATCAVPSVLLAQGTRAEVLERRRSEKAAALKPYDPGRLEELLLQAEEGRLRRYIAPHNGFFASYGYTYKPVGSGLGFGGGFRHDLFGRTARVELESGVSLRNYRMLRADFSLPRLFDERLELGAEAVYSRHPQEDFFGPGNESAQGDRANFLLSARDVRGRAVVSLAPALRVGARFGHLETTPGTGTDRRFPSIEERFTDREAPGLGSRSTFTYGEAFAAFDTRDEPGNARAGAHYTLGWRRYDAAGGGRFDFDAYNLLLQHFVPVFDKKRVFAFQLGLTGTTAAAGADVPFYMQPTVGGSRTVRSLDEYRLRDRHALWMNAEYRWEVFSALDMALFTDAGRVAPRLGDLDLSGLRRAYGIGFRFNTPQAVFLRVDLATGGGEGLRVFFKFSKAF